MTDEEFMRVVVERARKKFPEYEWNGTRSLTADQWDVLAYKDVGDTRFFAHKVWDRKHLTIAHDLRLSEAEWMIDLENENAALEVEARVEGQCDD